MQAANDSGASDASVFTVDATNGWIDLLLSGVYEMQFLGQWDANINLENAAWLWVISVSGFVHPITVPPVAGNNAVQAKPAFNDEEDRHYNVFAKMPVPLLHVSAGLDGPPCRVYPVLYVEGGNRTMDEGSLIITYREGWPL